MSASWLMTTMASWASGVCSYWRVRRRQRCIQAKVRSMTQRRGWVIKPPLELDPADDLDCEPQDPAHGLHHAAGVALLGPQMAEPGAAVAGSAEQPCTAAPILHAGRGDQHAHQQAQGGYDDVAFDAVDLLGAVEAARTTNG